MNFIVMVMAALFAMLSVAAADEWPRKMPRPATTAVPNPKSPVRDAARPAPARPSAVERGRGQVGPAAAEQREQPASAGGNPLSGAAPEAPREVGGSPEHNAQPTATDRAGATVGGE
jgi:hypothetical protein